MYRWQESTHRQKASDEICPTATRHAARTPTKAKKHFEVWCWTANLHEFHFRLQSTSTGKWQLNRCTPNTTNSFKNCKSSRVSSQGISQLENWHLNWCTPDNTQLQNQADKLILQCKEHLYKKHLEMLDSLT